MEDKVKKMVTFLQQKYESVATIFLHGSRARGKNGKHSDWDFIIFTNTTIYQDQFRAELEGGKLSGKFFLYLFLIL